MRLRYLFGIALALLALGATDAAAQQPVPSPTPPGWQLEWTHDGVNTDGFTVYTDGTAQDVGLPTRNPDGTYRVAFPAVTPGDHSFTVAGYNVAGHGEPSEPLLVRLIPVPSRPVGLILRAPE